MATLLNDHPTRIGVNGYPLTLEQEAILSIEPTCTTKWMAFAGCAKTTTSVEYSHAWPNHKALYLAFNASIAADAKGRFPQNVQTQTAHGHAYQVMGVSRFRDRVVNRLRPNDLDPLNDILHPIGNMSLLAVQRAVIRTLTNFLISGEDELIEGHLAGVPYQIRRAVMPMFTSAVERLMAYETNNLPFTHDIYLKAFARTRKISENFDYIIVDEAQDLNPVLIDIVGKSGLPAKIVGDPWQSIYSFRGAVSAMDAFNGQIMTLSQSFRFGPQIAEVANHVLKQSLDRPEHPIIGNAAKKSSVGVYQGVINRKSTILARTNFRLFESLVKLTRPFHMVGGIDDMINQVEAGYALYIGQRPKRADPMLSRFANWEQCKDASEYEDEPDLVRLVKIVEQYEAAIPEILHSMRSLHVAREEDAAFIVSTAHKAKGREWNHVVILDDFLMISQLKAMLGRKKITPAEYNQEINLIYVTVTRAIETLAISEPLYGEIAGGAGLAEQFWGMA